MSCHVMSWYIISYFTKSYILLYYIILYYIILYILCSRSSGQIFCLLIMRPRVRFSALPWEFFLIGKIPMVTMGWVNRIRLKGSSWYLISIYISPLTSLGQRSRALWASQPQKSPTLSPQPGGKTTKFVWTGVGIGGGMCFGEPHLFPERGSPTRLSTSGQPH